MKRYWFYELLKCPGDWTFMPWLSTGPHGWMFTWLFFGFGRITLTQEQVDYLVCDGEEDGE